MYRQRFYNPLFPAAERLSPHSIKATREDGAHAPLTVADDAARPQHTGERH
ncbi:hypothetical protein SDC9_190343 [bioreactor metagenome]|uniref:Uncharacterized protein n=1 Tax=bioreactor metagenome TaxID=1076179 RepID=A0A645HUQ2_9ZZZZ